ncbi:RAMP superfamily CRISPR-associated protein [Leadbettera azotonutricia]|uniref:Crispr-associated ramp protein, Cmr1 family n=1 Tax=Leadbettera azotonutricia (strain ATCC BAA-888 / DSM 13862 / ZAS-9) TaxID=545695 RepID=F5YD04_LEAAZ|nr:RAMP superfamily CRISPR-associated protein [Leadbettera azotonutricia]AEF82094.1 crispr-associated ramp protein, Cmr1 family [Leadbettera azotonutricia ZAS-9]
MNISRYYGTEKVEYEFEFLTPAFLGGHDGNAELRTPPFKNLIRRWWRVAGNENLSPENLWKEEAKLFGSASGEGNSASRIRIRIVNSQCTDSNEAINLGRVYHPEVGQGGLDIDAALYLGYGPVSYEKEAHKDQNGSKRSSTIKYKKYIIPGSRVQLEILMPKDKVDSIKYIMTLIHNFGAIGSRSRNGWGSLSVRQLQGGNKQILPGVGRIKECAVDWEKGFSSNEKRSYPHYIGKDDTSLLAWEVERGNDYEELLGQLAKLYLELRTSFKFPTDDKTTAERYVLGYPVTHHELSERKNKSIERVPSQLLLKIARVSDKNLSARIIHIPYKQELLTGTKINDKEVWEKVHAYLDGQNGLSRMGAQQ